MKTGNFTVRIFITLSFLLMFSEAPNQVAGKAAHRVPPKTEPAIPKSMVDSLKISIQKEAEINEQVKQEIQVAKNIATSFKKEAIRIIQAESERERRLKNQVQAKSNEVKVKDKRIDSLLTEVQRKDSTIYYTILNEKLKQDSICIRWKFLSKRNVENCTKWEIVKKIIHGNNF